jgi:hypothetical protein
MVGQGRGDPRGFDAHAFALGSDPVTAARLRGLITLPDQLTAADRLLAPAQVTAANTRSVAESLRRIETALGSQGSQADQTAQYLRQATIGATGRFVNQGVGF